MKRYYRVLNRVYDRTTGLVMFVALNIAKAAQLVYWWNRGKK